MTVPVSTLTFDLDAAQPVLSCIIAQVINYNQTHATRVQLSDHVTRD